MRNDSLRDSWVTRFFRILSHQITVFVGLQIVWVAITLLWVLWFADAIGEFAEIAKQLPLESLSVSSVIVVLVVGCVLLGVLMLGTVILFVSGLRKARTIRQQASFVSSVTHELRSPLASLQLSFETLSRRELDRTTTQKVLKMAREDIERLSRLVDSILISARLDRGLSPYEEDPKFINLGEHIHSLIEKAIWLDKDIRSRVTLSGELDTKVKAPEMALTLIFSNLIENAVKYSPKGSAVIVSIAKSDEQVLVSIKDSGFGVQPHDIKKVFRLFYRGQVSSQKAIPGTGVGLFIVKQVVKILRGSIWVESPGSDSGTTFCVTLPLTENSDGIT